MTASSSAGLDRAANRARRSIVLPALLFGLPLAAGILGVLYSEPLQGTTAHEYVKNPVECVEVVMFCVALGALGTMLLRNIGERRAAARELLPAWNGKPVHVSDAEGLLKQLDSVPKRLLHTGMVRRVHGVLDFLCRRGSAQELDDHIRDLADADSLALENSYALVRFITWAIPILGFLGTVLGITGAISGVTPDRLENDLNSVTDGLAYAFHTTALALALTMATMFLTFLVERAEQSVLDAVDRVTDQELAHRFERVGSGAGAELAGIVEQLTKKQTEMWAKALEEMERRRAEAEEVQMERLTGALEEALQSTLHAHGQRLAALEHESLAHFTAFLERMTQVAEAVEETGHSQRLALVQVAERIGGQMEALDRLQDGERHLLRLHDTLNQNLAAITAAGTFEQALHSLTAAVHLLTARTSGPLSVGSAPRPGKVA
jgi:biopolymer transport protein ExbB/TolQ